MLKQRKIKAGDALIKNFIKLKEKEINENIEKLARKLRIVGRKVIKERDFEEMQHKKQYL